MVPGRSNCDLRQLRRAVQADEELMREFGEAGRAGDGSSADGSEQESGLTPIPFLVPPPTPLQGSFDDPLSNTNLLYLGLHQQYL